MGHASADTGLPKLLFELAQQAQAFGIAGLNQAEPTRATELRFDLPGLHIDATRHLIPLTALRSLADELEARGFFAKREAMFRGDRINETENRAVLHTALRAGKHETAPLMVGTENVRANIQAAQLAVRRFADSFSAGKLLGDTGKPLRQVLNLGIGGSDLGPRLVIRALANYRTPGIDIECVSNVDGSAIEAALKRLDPETTLVCIASKTFTTAETLANARIARDWIVRGTGSEGAVAAHFAAMTSNADAAARFGIPSDRLFPFGDWVGGRFSLWSSIGLPIVLTLGYSNFMRLLEGAHCADLHFRTAPLLKNVPVIMGLLGIWYRNVLDWPTHAVLPYDQRLEYLVDHLQQLEMESNGKQVTLNGTPTLTKTCPILWGNVGTDAQHAFFQLLHQGTEPTPCDFIVAAQPDHAHHTLHTMLLANCFAQSDALARGRSEAEAYAQLRGNGATEADAARLAPHKTFPGNRPSTTFLLERLTPETLGTLLALYEHKVLTQSVFWQVNAFDQWGVELGKELAGAIQRALDSDDLSSLPPATRTLLEKSRSFATESALP